MYASAGFDDIDLDAKSQNQRCMHSAAKQATSIKFATTVGHFYVTLTLQMFIWLDHFVLCLHILPIKTYQNWFFGQLADRNKQKHPYLDLESDFRITVLHPGSGNRHGGLVVKVSAS